MTQDQIIEWAWEAARNSESRLLGCGMDDLSRFAALVAKHEREACALECDGWLHADGNRIAEALRARGKP